MARIPTVKHLTMNYEEIENQKDWICTFFHVLELEWIDICQDKYESEKDLIACYRKIQEAAEIITTATQKILQEYGVENKEEED